MAKKKLPLGIVDADLYVNGSNALEGVGVVELPNVESATITTEQFGMAAEFEAPLIGHYKKMSAKVKMDSMNETLLNFNNNDSITLECLGALQQLDRMTHSPKITGADATLKGFITKFDGPKVENGKKFEGSFDLSITYYKLTINGKTIIEIDVLNGISNVNGSFNNIIRQLLGHS